MLFVQKKKKKMLFVFCEISTCVPHESCLERTSLTAGEWVWVLGETGQHPLLLGWKSPHSPHRPWCWEPEFGCLSAPPISGAPTSVFFQSWPLSLPPSLTPHSQSSSAVCEGVRGERWGGREKVWHLKAQLQEEEAVCTTPGTFCLIHYFVMGNPCQP